MLGSFIQGTHCTGKIGKMAKKFPGNFEMLPNHRQRIWFAQDSLILKVKDVSKFAMNIFYLAG